jgi:hypothetical protein
MPAGSSVGSLLVPLAFTISGHGRRLQALQVRVRDGYHKTVSLPSTNFSVLLFVWMSKLGLMPLVVKSLTPNQLDDMQSVEVDSLSQLHRRHVSFKVQARSDLGRKREEY